MKEFSLSTVPERDIFLWISLPILKYAVFRINTSSMRVKSTEISSRMNRQVKWWKEVTYFRKWF